MTTFERALERFEKAVTRLALIGTVDRITEREEIEDEYETAKTNIIAKRKL